VKRIEGYPTHGDCLAEKAPQIELSLKNISNDSSGGVNIEFHQPVGLEAYCVPPSQLPPTCNELCNAAWDAGGLTGDAVLACYARCQEVK
jgi:hypothetical protein